MRHGLRQLRSALLRISRELLEGQELALLGLSELFQIHLRFFFKLSAICSERAQWVYFWPESSKTNGVCSLRLAGFSCAYLEGSLGTLDGSLLEEAGPGVDGVSILDSRGLQFLLELTFFVELEPHVDAQLLVFSQLA
uniref:Uncharacterized protein n=1 Tax=Strombidium inclinatum TaxID=197538 RepID=A0A7S3IDT6_9SPIT